MKSGFKYDLLAELNRLLVVLREWFDEVKVTPTAEWTSGLGNRAATIVNLVTEACDYEDGTASSYSSFEDVLVLLLPVAEQVRAFELSKLQDLFRGKDRLLDSLSRERIMIEKTVFGNNAASYSNNEQPKDSLVIWQEISAALSNSEFSNGFHDYFFVAVSNRSNRA